eukprot:Plantae.Rhodophyta-Palmaria_palmata.ctg5155.p2 GENE.Plantae.Rhodophyta-Palmaria_palmata.ctg5155~~Plantae.Rhodophyta-Palmaria_palmata.ctg5155.p2  ORF type:complete len:111 (+),score=11.80 Plantae.Rhodophyta-Palmaria_palmata.ctg5155:491-823(+)
MDINDRDGFFNYNVRFENTTNPVKRLVFMTNGAILNELSNDDYLTTYSTVVVGKAQERSMDSKLLLCMMKVLLANESKLSASKTTKVLSFSQLRTSTCFRLEYERTKSIC